MADVVLWLVMIVCLVAAATVLVVSLVRRQLRRANRVARTHAGSAPSLWLWSPGRAAQLHRRLQRAIAPVDPDGPGVGAPLSAPETDALRSELTEQACRLDEWLVWVHRRRQPHRRRLMETVTEQVDAVEGLAGALCGHASISGRGTRARGDLAELAARIGSLQEAREEIQRSTAALSDRGRHVDQSIQHA